MRIYIECRCAQKRNTLARKSKASHDSMLLIRFVHLCISVAFAESACLHGLDVGRMTTSALRKGSEDAEIYESIEKHGVMTL